MQTTPNNVFPLNFSPVMPKIPASHMKITWFYMSRKFNVLLEYLLCYFYSSCFTVLTEALQALRVIQGFYRDYKGLEKLKGIWESRREGKRVELLDFTEVNYLGGRT